MRQSKYLPKDESKKPCYILVGQQIKYDPTWVANVPLYDNYQLKKGKVEQGQILKETNSTECMKSLTQSIGHSNLKKAQ